MMSGGLLLLLLCVAFSVLSVVVPFSSISHHFWPSSSSKVIEAKGKYNWGLRRHPLYSPKKPKRKRREETYYYCFYDTQTHYCLLYIVVYKNTTTNTTRS